MSEPQFLNHSDPGRLATIQSKGPQEDTPSKAKHLSSHTSWKTSPVACFDPPLEVIPSSNPITNSKKAADTGHPDLGGLLVRNKNLSAEVRNLQNKLLIKETSLQEMKSELKTYKENNAQQSYQIMSLKDDIKDLKEINASLIRIKTLKNTNIQILERGNWDLTERIMELENRVRILLVERKKAEHKSDLLETKLAGANRFPSCMNMKGPEDFINMFTMKDKDEAILDKNFEKDNIFHSDGPKGKQKFGDKCQQDLICKEKQIFELERPPYSFIWETKASQSQYQTLLNQLATLLSYSVGLVPATEEAVKEKIQEIGANEQSWKSKTEDLQQEIQILTKQLEELHHLYEETVQSSQAEEKYREQKKSLKCLEGKIDINDFFQGTLDFDKNKEKTIEKLRQSLIKVEMMKEKAVMKTDNLKTTLDSAEQEQEAQPDIEPAQQMLNAATHVLSPAKSTLQYVPGREQELVDFRETITKMLGFNMKTADHEVINQLKLIIQAYEEASKSKFPSDCETGQ
ncbi:coiled-coil domain-containing protein 170-like isoform X2 [Dasypus novemcinctus]|uniref:coiled-coil domain-containing protein 170-like isoform X2 n=1 Tax=Dasypus novemcinctus TaxID=9361 RepID=UPI00265E434A|nr:coiled-coil domain-containing protein 170-like isoform X2 [Dasypus novemcinctus]